MPTVVKLRISFVLALTTLLVLLQNEFYRAHDIFPGFSIPLSIACELSLLSLASMKLGKHDWLRKLAWVMIYGYIVASLSFHVIYHARTQIQQSSLTAPSGRVAELNLQLAKEEIDLAFAKKAKAWKLVDTTKAEIHRLRNEISRTPPEKLLWMTDEFTIAVSALLIIVFRLCLPAVNSLNMTKLREELAL
ncbi:MAG TPA: hypothetical protein VE954_05925 [Oligoflexus sp.]|nr:hypothetical protein [Oligoflexus sp.]